MMCVKDRERETVDNQGVKIEKWGRAIAVFATVVLLLGLFAGATTEIAAQESVTDELDLLEQLRGENTKSDIIPTADNLQLSIVVAPTEFSRGDVLTYTMTLINLTGSSVTNVIVIDTLPAETTYVQDSATGSARLVGDSLMWELDSLNNSSAQEFSYQVRVNISSTTNAISNYAAVSSDQTPSVQSNVCTSTLKLTYVYLPVIMKNWPPIPLVPTLNQITNATFGTSGMNYTVSWQEDAGTGEQSAIQFVLQEASDSTFSSINQEWSVSSSTLSRAFTNKPLGSYYYRLRACNSNGCSNWSDYQYILVRLPAQPTLNSVNNNGSGDYTVSWNDPDPDLKQNYYLQESTDNFASLTNHWDNLTASSYQIADRSAGTYYYRVRGESSVGSGPWSNVVTVQVDPPVQTGWTQRAPANSPAIDAGAAGRAGHKMAYANNRDVVVMFGGGNEGWARQDLWEWNGTNWTHRTSTNGLYPPPRREFAMVYDSARGVVLVYGGFYEGDVNAQQQTMYRDLYLPFATAQEFQERFLHGIGLLTTQYEDLWQWDGTNWTQLSMGDDYPGERSHIAGVYDSARQQFMVVGGFSGDDTGSGYKKDTWMWNGSLWYKSEAWTGNRHSHAMAYDPVRAVTVLFGGYYNTNNANDFYNDTWEWNGSGWVQRSAGGSAGAFPSKRRGAAMFYDHQRDSIMVFGGFNLDNGGTFYNDIFEWDPTYARWNQIINMNPIPSRRMSAAVAYDAVSNTTANTPVVLYSGYTGGLNFPDDTWEYR